ncbi:hypothetical protein [Streptomyces wuyuanensis]|uniref:hypothetical protein n=1 Tax=Streptomyces wuyuanensis TaxID=1196353 RepID=UPI0037961915
MADADQLKIQTVLGAVATLFEEKKASILTDGHTFTVRRGPEAVAHLEGLLEQGTALQEAALRLTTDNQQVRPRTFTTHYTQALSDLGIGGANPNPVFTAMMALNQIHELGLRPESDDLDTPWSRPTLHNPAPRVPPRTDSRPRH